jgi:hypothetical protein
MIKMMVFPRLDRRGNQRLDIKHANERQGTDKFTDGVSAHFLLQAREGGDGVVE